MSALKAAEVRCAVLRLIINLAARHSIEEQSSNVDSSEISKSHVKRAIFYLNANYREHITLDRLAAQVGITKYQLARLFKNYTGGTVTDYLNTKRCSKAGRCLERGMTVSGATTRCGFESILNFSRVYKRFMGVSPSS